MDLLLSHEEGGREEEEEEEGEEKELIYILLQLHLLPCRGYSTELDTVQ